MRQREKKYRYYIGIDTGVVTGFGVWIRSAKKFETVDSGMIHTIMDRVKVFAQYNNGDTFVRVEDARLRKWIPKERGREALQGAGSIKRDAKIWEDFLTDIGIDFEMVPPKNNKTKMSATYFNRVTKWKDKTNEHARDAAMLVFGI